jgi:hypothetical protein
MLAERPSKRRCAQKQHCALPLISPTEPANDNTLPYSSAAYTLAEQYRIGTARLPLSVLSNVWRVGQNRPLSTKQIQHLLQVYKKEGLLREPEAHHLIVGCTRGEFQQAIAHATTLASTSESSRPEPLTLTRSRTLPAGQTWPLLAAWSAINNGSKVELIAGQHRVAAFEQLLLERRQGSTVDGTVADDDAWWVCDFYDTGVEPFPSPLRSSSILLVIYLVLS